MAVYLLLLILPAAWIVLPRSRAAALAVGAVLAIFIGLRDRVGGDWHAYWLIYERAKSLDAVSAMLLNDPAFMALNIAASRLGLGIAFVNLACAAILSAGLVAYARCQKLPWLALFIAIPVLVMVASMNSTRQATAVGLEMLAFAFYLRGRPRACGLALLFAFAFHWSAAVLLPFAALALLPPQRLRLAAWVAAGLGAVLVVAVWLRSDLRIFYQACSSAAQAAPPSGFCPRSPPSQASPCSASNSASGPSLTTSPDSPSPAWPSGQRPRW